MTGMSQSVGFIKNNPGGKAVRENLREEDITFAEKLKGAGYATAYFGKYGLGPLGMSGYPLNKGFDVFTGYDTHKAAHDYYPAKICENDQKITIQEKGGNKIYTHDLFAAKALEYLDKEHSRPFCLFLGFTLPHGPYNPPGLGEFADKNWNDLDKKYAAMLTLLDKDIGRILGKLKSKRTGRKYHSCFHQ